LKVFIKTTLKEQHFSVVCYICTVIKFSRNSIPFSAASQFPKLFLDYVSGADQLRKFYSFTPDQDGYIQASGKLNYREEFRSVLVEVIRDQYKSTEISTAENLLEKLAEKGAMTVCTGHQLCLFTGPLYFIYKIITTIKVAEEQSVNLGKPVIPVYWMASEDHDFDEISSVHLFGKTLKWETEAKGAVGNILTDSLSGILEELKVLLGVSLDAMKFFASIEKAYRPGRTLAQATREFVNVIFENKILILDPNDVRLKKCFSDQFKNEIEKQSSEISVNKSIGELASLGYAAQVNPRKINLFFMKKNIRERIEEKDGKFQVLNTKMTFSKEELIYEIENYPGNFSPNVVLRPLFQQLILPNIAYIGGPGEISYWLEYKRMFDESGILFPVLQPRHFALIIDKNSEERLRKFEIQLGELFGDVEELIKTFVRKNAGDSISLDSEKEELKKIFDAVRSKIVPVDASLKGNVDAELQKQINALENLESKVMRAAKQKQETAIAQIKKLREKILPEGNLQERYENFIPFYLKHGNDFIPMLENEFDLPVEKLLILSEE
jgi:bacillithiol biosynthesis cysteine-adding enzyme BshC